MRRIAVPALALLASAAVALTVWHTQQRRSGAAATAATGPVSREPAERRDAASPEASDADYPRPGPGVNLLALEASPYLQLHARNPVDWYPWGDRAFERARAEDKPVFLSVGYSTCYWCHVMERKVFSDPEIAAYMNRHFVSIKVDREERPDIDSVYMQATHLLTRSGGWPNSVFLTPEGKPFFAGTYFPPRDGRGRPGFPRVLRRLHDAWSGERERVLRVADRVAERIERASRLGSRGGEAVPPPAELLGDALRELEQGYDPEHGGFSSRVKFPRPTSLELLLTALEREPDAEQRAMLTHTLDQMALGGIYDHLAGGFHRYATEPTWSIPHFEKMLYDNAQLVGIYARAHALTGRPLYRRVVEETVAYLDREMSHPEGGFASAQDAQVDGEEGASYVWTREQIEQALGEERAEDFLSVYELAPMPEDSSHGVLRVRLPLERSLERTGAESAAALLARFDDERAALLEARRRRPQPLRDDKVLAAWNGLAIRGLVQAAEVLERPGYRERAERAARFVLARLLAEDGALHRSYVAGQARERAVLDDYAFLADGLLALHRATREPPWLERARELADAMLAGFHDPEGGGFHLTPGGSQLLVRPKPFDDDALPSGNAVALRALRSLAKLTGEPRYRRAADGTAAAAAGLLRRAPSALAGTVAALAREPGSAVASASGPRNESGSPDAEAPDTEADAFRLPHSEDHVRASLERPGNERSQWVVRLAVDAGWHVNANPASLPFLVPTQVVLDEAEAEVRVRYPEGKSFRPDFAPEAIRVYEGTVDIPISLAEGAKPPARIALRFQACDESRCLPPGRAELAPGDEDARPAP